MTDGENTGATLLHPLLFFRFGHGVIEEKRVLRKSIELRLRMETASCR